MEVPRDAVGGCETSSGWAPGTGDGPWGRKAGHGTRRHWPRRALGAVKVMVFEDPTLLGCAGPSDGRYDGAIPSELSASILCGSVDGQIDV